MTRPGLVLASGTAGVAAGSLEGTAGATLIIPAVSFGNVGQLATDLFLQTMRAERVGHLRSPHVVPMVGNDAFDMGQPGILATALELFHLPRHPKVFVIQQRAPLLKGRLAAYARDLVEWAAEMGFTRIVTLASGDASERGPGQMEGSQLWYAYSGQGKGSEQVPATGEWRALEPRDMSTLQDGSGPYELQVPGSGFALLVHEEVEARTDLDCIVLVRFCNEGDNTSDAHSLASKVNALLKLEAEPVRWQAPMSWSHLFGSFKHSRLY